MVETEKLIPYQDNMNIHSKEQIDKLCELIEYQGFRDPLIVQKGTNIIAAGHGRLEAAKKLKIKKVPVTYQEFENEAQLYSFVVSHNAVAKDEWAELDRKLVEKKLESLDIDVSKLALKDFNVETETIEPQCDEDEVPEVNNPIT